MIIRRTVLLALLVSLTYGAWAQSPSEVLAVQFTLNRLGIDVGEGDGTIGPILMAGLRRYSETYGGGDDLYSVRYVMERLNEQNRRPVEDEQLIARIKEAVKVELLDAESAQFRNLYFAPSPSGPESSVCGEVNAKNKFGGYVGFQDFTMSVMDMSMPVGDNPKKWHVLFVRLASEPNTFLMNVECRLYHPPEVKGFWRRQK